MKRQEIGNPKVSLSWVIDEDGYNLTTLDSEKGKKQLVDTILMLLDQGMEIRIGTDGMCLILEANDADSDYTDASYQYIDDEHYVESYNHTYEDAKDFSSERGSWYDAAVKEALEKINHSYEAKYMSDKEILEEIEKRG